MIYVNKYTNRKKVKKKQKQRHLSEIHVYWVK